MPLNIQITVWWLLSHNVSRQIYSAISDSDSVTHRKRDKKQLSRQIHLLNTPTVPQKTLLNIQSLYSKFYDSIKSNDRAFTIEANGRLYLIQGQGQSHIIINTKPIQAHRLTDVDQAIEFLFSESKQNQNLVFKMNQLIISQVNTMLKKQSQQNQQQLQLRKQASSLLKQQAFSLQYQLSKLNSKFLLLKDKYIRQSNKSLSSRPQYESKFLSFEDKPFRKPLVRAISVQAFIVIDLTQKITSTSIQHQTCSLRKQILKYPRLNAKYIHNALQSGDKYRSKLLHFDAKSLKQPFRLRNKYISFGNKTLSKSPRFDDKYLSNFSKSVYKSLRLENKSAVFETKPISRGNNYRGSMKSKDCLQKRVKQHCNLRLIH